MTYRHIISTSSISRDYGYTAERNSDTYGAVTEYDDMTNTWTDLEYRKTTICILPRELIS